MKIIDKYILKRYLVTFFVMLIMFVPIGIVIDVSEKGPEELRTDKRYEATQSIRITYAPWALFRWKS